MPESPAEAIRRAAGLMRERAMVALTEVAHQGDGTPAAWWSAHGSPSGASLDSFMADCDAEHAAPFSPAMALRLADSWFALADEMADYPAVLVPLGVGIASRPGEPSMLWTHTYSAAVAYLGESGGGS